MTAIYKPAAVGPTEVPMSPLRLEMARRKVAKESRRYERIIKAVRPQFQKV